MSTPIQSPMLKLLVSLLLLSSLGDGFAFEGNETTENLEFHTVQLSSMQPSSTCIPSTKGSGEGTYLKLVHKHGPCSPLFQKGRGNALSAFETLKLDQSRMDAMKSMVTKPDVITLPCTSYYIVTVGLGTPTRELSFSFDTGSSLTWTQCNATGGHYFRQKHPLFVVAKSKTFKGIKCSSPICPERSSNCASTSPCIYSIEYGDKTISQGIYGRDRLTLTSSDVIDNFQFGCGTRNSGIFHELEEDGILGLSRRPVSIVQQTAKKYHQVFSYCIPSKSGFTGFLRFGGGGQESIIYTAMTNYKDSSFYGINMIGISVAGKKLPIPSTIFAKAGSIIDSGTDVTRLPRGIYIPLRDAYRKAMSQYKLVKPEDLGQISELYDTCHFLGRQKSFKFPKVSFILSGGVAVDIPPSGIYFQVLKTVVCFAFAAKPLDGGPGIIWGSFQQRTLEVVHDVGRRKIGFGYGACK